MKSLFYTLAAAAAVLPLSAEDIDREALAAEAARVQAENDAQQAAEQETTQSEVKEAMLNLAKAPMMFAGVIPGEEDYTYIWGGKRYTTDEFCKVLKAFSEANGKDGLAIQVFYNMDDISDDAAQRSIAPLFHDYGFVAVGLVAIPAVSFDEILEHLAKQPAVNAKLPE